MYMFTFLISIGLTLFALFKGVGWVNILILNIIISVIFNFMGLGGFDLLTNIVTYIIDILRLVMDFIIDLLISPFIDFFDRLFSFDWSLW